MLARPQLIHCVAAFAIFVSTCWSNSHHAIAGSPDDPANWAQWRGPLETGLAPEGKPPVAWSETNNISWKVKVPGSGSSTPIIWGDKIFLLTAISTGKKPADAPAAEAATAEEPAVEKSAGEKPADETPSAEAASPEALAETPRADEPRGESPREGDRPRRRRGGFGAGGGFGGGGFGGGEAPTDLHQFVVLCLDRKTGETLWQHVAKEVVPHEGHHRDHGFASFSPVTDGEHLIAYFGSRGLHCYDLDGNLKWSKDLGRMQTRNGFGEGSSPALHGNVVVVNWDHEGADDFIAAFNKVTGEELWRTPREEATTWATPIIVEYEGQAQVITAATGKVRSYELETGKLIWECAGLTPNAIPTPIASDGMVYVTSGFRGNAMMAIKLGATGDLTDSDSIAWRHDRNTPYVPSPLLYDHLLYFFSGNNGILSVFDVKTGEAVIGPQRIAALSGVYASPVGANGYVYLVGRDGSGVVIKHADKFEIVATNKLDEGIDASPAIVGKQLFLRGQQHLYCIEEKAAE